MANNLVSRASVTISAPADKVWDALVNPELIKQYMFGADVVSDWKEKSPITWKGEYNGKKYEDKGVILKVEPGKLIQYSHFSPLAGKPDIPENYHVVTIELSEEGETTGLLLSQDNNPTEESREHTEVSWQGMLETLKKLME